METMTKRVKLDRMAKQYILEAIASEAYEIETADDGAKVRFLGNTFKKEYDFAIKRSGPQTALAEWFMGLPSACTIAFENYRILELAREWGSLPKDATEAQEQKILDLWFMFMAAKTLQLFRKYNVTF